MFSSGSFLVSVCNFGAKYMRTARSGPSHLHMHCIYASDLASWVEVE